jgi:2-C-methyl-D-erythritol 4-phosphate cytidylyltransferase
MATMAEQMRPAVVVLAAGSGTRFGHSTNKVWLPLSGRRIISRSLTIATRGFDKPRAVLVINPADEELAKQVIAREIPEIKVEIVYGGSTRHESEFNAIKHLEKDIRSGNINVILIHDGARPLATSALFKTIAETAHRHGGAIPTIPVNPLEIDQRYTETLVRVQTPQGYQAQLLLDAYEAAAEVNFHGTDTGACVEKFLPNVKTVSVNADATNVKITYPQDLAIAEHVLEKRGYTD